MGSNPTPSATSVQNWAHLNFRRFPAPDRGKAFAARSGHSLEYHGCFPLPALGVTVSLVAAIKIEGRQRSRSYTRDVVTSFRRAVDAIAHGRPIPSGGLGRLSEGQTTTAGAYRKTWR